MKLEPLRPNDTIAVVAPASPFDEDQFHQACALLEDRGYRVQPGASVLRRQGYLAGTEAERSTDLTEAFCSPEVQAVIAARGGYGSSRLLPWLSFARLQPFSKIFLGHSDITFLHAAFRSRMSWMTFHGPNLLDLANGPQHLDQVLLALSGTRPFGWSFENEQIIQEGSASGPLVGGNLTCLVHLLGTPYLPPLAGAILLLEDRAEAPYRIDRMLNHLRLAGVLDQIGGVLLGSFEECGDPEALRDLFSETFKPYSIPVVDGFPAGHGDSNQVVPLGAPAVMDTREGTVTVTDHPFFEN